MCSDLWKRASTHLSTQQLPRTPTAPRFGGHSPVFIGRRPDPEDFQVESWLFLGGPLSVDLKTDSVAALRLVAIMSDGHWACAFSQILRSRQTSRKFFTKLSRAVLGPQVGGRRCQLGLLPAGSSSQRSVQGPHGKSIARTPQCLRRHSRSRSHGCIASTSLPAR
jgi:hypothetical protein